MKNNYQQLLRKIENKEEIVFGLLLDKKGSAPQVPGASALFNTKGLLHGTLGGGILELEAENLAISQWNTRNNQIKQIDYTSDIGEDGGAICGGIATFLLDFNPQSGKDALQAMDRDLRHQNSGYLITSINKKNDNISITRLWLNNIEESKNISPVVKTNFITNQKKQKSELISTESQLDFIEYLTPAPQLIIIGAGHIGQALCHHGALLGFDVTVVDNRPSYATHSLVSDAHQIIVNTDLSESIQELAINANSYIVIATQGHKSDCEALEKVIHSEASYIGMIGSKRKIQQVKTDFEQRGIAKASQFSRIHAPIGLSIGSKTVQEIAISIAAELIQERNIRR